MKTEFSERDWNFDNVPNAELVACCYWEYARESAFIRDVRRRCLDPNWKTMVNSELWKFCGHDIERVQSIGYASEVFLRGFFFPPNVAYQSGDPKKANFRHPHAPPLTGSFPKPWQALTKAERNCRKHIGSDVECIPLVPFDRGYAFDANDILDWIKTQRANAEAERERVHRENPKLNEETFGLLKFPSASPSVYWEGGAEATIVRINWGSFTNDQIVNYFRDWVKKNRPAQYPMPSRQGRKPNDWRVNLTRLAVMRLLSHFSLREIFESKRPECAAIREAKQFSGAKWQDMTKWRDAKREAGKVFRRIFPFLPAGEMPLASKRPDK